MKSYIVGLSGAHWAVPLLSLYVCPVLGAEGGAGIPARNEWYRHSLVNIHFDNHSSLLGQGQTVDELTAALSTVPVQMIQVSAQSNGYATYPTEVGLDNPGRKSHDTLGTFKEVARRLGLKLCVYMSVDRRPLELKDHPEWAAVGADGQPIIVGDPIVCQRPNREKKGYLYERFIPQIREIISKYDPDGFWFDGDYILTRPCWCERCLREWKQDTGTEAPRDPAAPEWDRWIDWHYTRYQSYLRHVAEAIHTASPKALYTSNWSWAWSPEPIPDFVDTLSGDAWNIAQVICATSRWGAQQKTPWDIMSYATPESRSLANRYSLQRTLQEGAVTMAAGGVWFAWTFSGGKVPPWGVEVTRHMAEFTRDRAPALGPSVSASQVAVLDSETSWRLSNRGDPDRPVFTVLRSLQEARYATDVVNEEAYLAHTTPYEIVILPEGRVLASRTLTDLRRFVERGGLLLVMGEGLRGRRAQESAEAVALLGLRREEQPEAKPVPLQIGGRLHHIVGTWPVELVGAEVVSTFADGRPALTRNRVGQGTVAYLATGGLIYPDDGLLAAALASLGKGPSYAVEGVGDAPVVCSLRTKPGQVVLHVTDLTTRVAGRRCDIDTTETTEWNPPLRNLRLLLPFPHQPKAVRAVPTLTGVEWEYANGVLALTLDMLHTHAAVIIETDAGLPLGLLPPEKAGPRAAFHPESEIGGVVFSDDFEAEGVGQKPGGSWIAEVKDQTAIVVTEETAVGVGRKSLKFVDTPDSSFWPFLHRSVAPFRTGKARLTFDLRVDEGATCLLEIRYEGKGPGPSVRFDGDKGVVSIGGRELMKLTPGVWNNVMVDFTLGVADPKYSLTVTPAGQDPQIFADLPYASEWFFLCNSVYFVGAGEKSGVFYLDNIVFERMPTQ